MLIQMVTQGILGADVGIFKDAPLAAVAKKIAGPLGASLLLITAAISCFGAVGADVLATPRSLFAGANDGTFPKFLGKVHPKFATPYLAVITYGTLIFIFSVSGGFKQLAIMASAAILFIYLAVILSTIEMRRKKTDKRENIFIIPLGLTIPFIGIATIIWLLTSLSKWEILSTIIFIAVISLIYFATQWMKSRNIIGVGLPGIK
jgi:basic amino acid/polyamine antiporter, APA family